MLSKSLSGAFIIVFCLICGIAGGQERACFRVVFYNVENLFDTRKDSVKADGDFTPRGRLYWTKERYSRKLLHISRALIEAGGEVLPSVIGLAEIENRQVLSELISKTGLADGDYGIVHADSPDARGIDVALLYRKADFKESRSRFFPVELEKGERTRDILYCEGVLGGSDTLHFFVCHFPSMRGGEARSEWKRVRAAAVVKEKIDSIQSHHTEAKIVVMGDLNGRANTRAQQVLDTGGAEKQAIVPSRLYNTGYYLLGKSRGSYRYRGEWQTLDHLIVSGSLLDGVRGLQSSVRMEVVASDFLLEEEKGSYGKRPKPTYRGQRYIGGYSDHLPVFIDLQK